MTTETVQAAQPTTHASLEREIADLRAKAERLSRHDPRRDAIDTKVDALVDRWLAHGRTTAPHS